MWTNFSEITNLNPEIDENEFSQIYNLYFFFNVISNFMTENLTCNYLQIEYRLFYHALPV